MPKRANRRTAWTPNLVASALRQRLGLAIPGMAEAVGAHRVTVWEVEHGRKAMSRQLGLRYWERFSDDLRAIGCGLEDLYRGAFPVRDDDAPEDPQSSDDACRAAEVAP